MLVQASYSKWVLLLRLIRLGLLGSRAFGRDGSSHWSRSVNRADLSRWQDDRREPSAVTGAGCRLDGRTRLRDSQPTLRNDLLVTRGDDRMQGQGRRAVLMLAPLLLAGVYHLVVGGSVVVVVVAVAVVFFGVGLDVSHRRRVEVLHQQAVAMGRQVWRASITTDSLLGLTPVSGLLRIFRDLIPVEVEVDQRFLTLTPPHRYRRAGVTAQQISWAEVDRLDRQPLGHVRPDGSLSTQSVIGVTVKRKRGEAVDLVFDAGGIDFLNVVGVVRGPGSSPAR